MIVVVVLLGIQSISAQDTVEELQKKLKKLEAEYFKREESRIELHRRHEIELRKSRQETREALATRPTPPKPKPEPKPIKTPAIQNQFYLKDRNSGKVHGPYEAAKGARIRIGISSFTYVKKELSPVEKKLASVIIPQTDFRQANVWDVVTYLRSAVPEFSQGPIRVNFVLTPHPDQDNKVLTRNTPLITLEMVKTSVLEILMAMAEKANLEYKFSGNTVTIYHKKK